MPSPGSSDSIDGNTVNVTLLSLPPPESLTVTLYLPTPAWLRFSVAMIVSTVLLFTVAVTVPVVPVCGLTFTLVIPPLNAPKIETCTGESLMPACDGAMLSRCGCGPSPPSQFAHQISLPNRQSGQQLMVAYSAGMNSELNGRWNEFCLFCSGAPSSLTSACFSRLSSSSVSGVMMSVPSPLAN